MLSLLICVTVSSHINIAIVAFTHP
uniref:Uncharacterized protein n=1 Tax=Arundo donax TaxID=35708 RepID=A0A0A9C852_ARUDO